MAFTPRGGSRGGSRGGFGGGRGYFPFHYLGYHIDDEIEVAVVVLVTEEDEEVDVLDLEVEAVESLDVAAEVHHVVEEVVDEEQEGDPELLLNLIDILVRLVFQFC